eukprot:6478747-Amphidinium_carterae.4
MILDCRATNKLFRAPPRVACGTGACWQNIRIPGEKQIFTTLSDLKDYFYSMGLPESLWKYFGLEDVTGKEVLGMFPGAKCLEYENYCPVMKVLPMGWSWAFYFGQQAHVAEVCRSLQLNPEDLLSDTRPAPEVVDNVLLVLPYCDNLTIGSDCQEVADAARESVAALCRRAGYIVHEEESASLCVRSLGSEIDGASGILSVGAKRFQKVEALLRYVIRHPVVNGRQLERVLGQVTFLFLIRRDLLSVFGRCYSFVRAHYQHPHRLWGSCLQELRAAVGLLPLAIADLRRSPSCSAYMTDASLRGFGVMQGIFAESDVLGACKFDERWRFKREYRNSSKARDVLLD